jgi:hypothetical protein
LGTLVFSPAAVDSFPLLVSGLSFQH